MAKSASRRDKLKLSLPVERSTGTVEQNRRGSVGKTVLVETKKSRKRQLNQVQATNFKVDDQNDSGSQAKKAGNAARTGKFGLTSNEAVAREIALKKAQEREADKEKLIEIDSKLDTLEEREVDAPQLDSEVKRSIKSTGTITSKDAVGEVAEDTGKKSKKSAITDKSTEAEGEELDIPESRSDESTTVAMPMGEEAENDVAQTEQTGRKRNRKQINQENLMLDHGEDFEEKKKSPRGKLLNFEQFGNRRGGATTTKQRPTKTTSRGGKERRRTKLTVTRALNDDGSQQRGRSLASLRRRREKEKRAGQQIIKEKISREVTIPETISIQELALRMAERSVDVIKLLMSQGHMMKVNDILDADMAQLVAEELGHTVKRVSEADVEEGLFSLVEDEGELFQRPPVVTIMGHVDHGKTSLLDMLRKSNVVSGEAGGITQHIGAYQVEQGGRKVTFIDTPGHAAFTQMRARGARVTDIVVLVVAADDGVMPQTREAIAHAKAAEVPMILAINKIDKPSIDVNKIKTELLQEEVVVESMGGDVLEVEVSALKGTNIDNLLDSILLQAELLELKANPARVAEGVVIEAKLDMGRGNVATVLVQKGTLRVGDILIGGSEWGRVRALIDDHGNHIDQAEPSKPVEVLGFNGTPEAGDLVAVVGSESRAREISEYRYRKRQEMIQARGVRGSLEQMMMWSKTEGMREFVLVIKGDVQGSIEAILEVLESLNTEEVRVRVIHSAAGAVTESDVTLATASNAVIMGFNVRANQQARMAAKTAGIEIRYYNVIYDLVNDVKAAMSGLLSPERKETFLGNAEVLEIFSISKVGKIAGCRISEGVIRRGAYVRLIRDDVVVHVGELGTLKHFKSEVKEVEAGQECGMSFATYQDMKPGDVIECFTVQEIARSL